MFLGKGARQEPRAGGVDRSIRYVTMAVCRRIRVVECTVRREKLAHHVRNPRQ